MSGRAAITRTDLLSVTETGQEASANRLDHDVLPLDTVEKLMIERAIGQSAGNITRAAELLGLSRSALYRRLAKHGLEPS
jgi:transcriptional regulator of acetoin/glycerol metabolism